MCVRADITSFPAFVITGPVPVIQGQRAPGSVALDCRDKPGNDGY